MTKKLSQEYFVLKNMEKIFGQERWIKGDFEASSENKGTCYYIVGALLSETSKIAGPNNINLQVRVLELLGFSRWADAYAWNDAANRRIKHIQQHVTKAKEQARAL